MQDRYEEDANATAALRVEEEPWQSTNKYRSAHEEKDLMRRRYEEAVAAAERQNSESSVTTIPGPSRLTSNAMSSAVGSSRDRSQTRSAPGHDDASRQTETMHLTASEEKEQMRQRYEAAVRAAQNSKDTKPSDTDSGNFHYSETQDGSRDRREASDERMSEPPPLPAKPFEVEQYAKILSSPAEEPVNPFMYMNSGMIPMFPAMFPGPIPGMDYSQAANGYYYQPRGDPHQAQ